MSELLYRSWFDNDTKEQIKFIITKIPVSIMSQAINLIEHHDKESVGEERLSWRRFMIKDIYYHLKFPNHAINSSSDKYDKLRELDLLLDGWVWNCSSTDNTETDNTIVMKSIREAEEGW